MLTSHTIERHVRTGRLEPLLHAPAHNGAIRPLPPRARRAQAPAGPLGLALRRLTELQYAPSDLSLDLAARILDDQDHDGAFHSDPLATAAALAGLIALQNQTPSDDFAPESTPDAAALS